MCPLCFLHFVLWRMSRNICCSTPTQVYFNRLVVRDSTQSSCLNMGYLQSSPFGASKSANNRALLIDAQKLISSRWLLRISVGFPSRRCTRPISSCQFFRNSRRWPCKVFLPCYSVARHHASSLAKQPWPVEHCFVSSHWNKCFRTNVTMR